jgi:hypothetical protein
VAGVQDLETNLEFLLRPYQRALVDHWPRPTPAIMAPFFTGVNTKSFEWLEQAYQQRDPGLPEIKSNPLFKNLRRDPRYAEFLKKMRLPA